MKSKLKEKYLSKCCNAEVEMEGGTPDFIGDKHASTFCFICKKCKKPCDIIVQDKLKEKIKERPWRKRFRDTMIENCPILDELTLKTAEDFIKQEIDQVREETKKGITEDLEFFLRDMEVRLHSEPFEIVKSAVKEIIKKI